jgi:hypothetical protein
VGILPQTYLAVREALGIPNNGDLHISERLHLNGKDILDDAIEITAPRILTAPWMTTRSYFRQRARKIRHRRGRLSAGLLFAARGPERQFGLRAHPSDRGRQSGPPGDQMNGARMSIRRLLFRRLVVLGLAATPSSPSCGRPIREPDPHRLVEALVQRR